MNGELMVVAIVLIIAISKIMQARYRGERSGRRETETANVAARDDGEAERQRGEIRQLKERIQVLEAIVTDGDRNRSLALEREIEALRGPVVRVDGEGAK